jgi:hypothetical protein
MIRTASLVLLASSLVACAAAPKSDTEALLHGVLRGNPTQLNCAAAMYCETSGSRISGGDRYRTCTCDPPAAMHGIPVGR